MKIKPFKLERYFAKYEFTAPHLLSCSDCEGLSLKELLSMADTDSIKLWDDLKLGYTESQGHPVLREEISKLYQTIKPEDLLVAVPEEAIFVAMNNLLEKGDHVITTFPGYQSLYEVANSLGCELSKWEPKEKEGWHFEINDLEELIRDNTKLIVINFPHNPTGAVLCESDLKKIVDIAKQKNIIIFSDEMYRFLEHDSKNSTPSVCDLYENGISLFGMSKTFALAGLRLGWLATKNQGFLNRFKIFKDYTTICNSAPSEILAIIGLRAKNQIIERNLRIIDSNLELLDDFFDRYSKHFNWTRPKAGPIGFPRLNMNIDAKDFCQDLVDTKGVMLLPANVYDYKCNSVRVGFARNSMPEALAKLTEYMEENY